MIKHFLYFLLLSGFVFGQNPKKPDSAFGHPFMKYFGPHDYKMGPRNWSLTQDHRGVMYFANEDGILEFDGKSWRKISVPGDQTVRSLTTDEKGVVYVCAGTDFGFLRPDSNSQLQFYSLRPQFDKTHTVYGEIWDVTVLGNSAYFKTADEIIIWKNNKFSLIDSVFSFRLYKLNNSVYTRNQGVGLMEVVNDSVKLIPGGDYFSNTGVFDLLPLEEKSNSSKNSMLITTRSKGLFVYRDGKINRFNSNAHNYLIENQLYNSTLTSDGKYAFATERGGIAIVNSNGNFEKAIDESSGLTTNVIFDVYSDKNGGLWLATEDGITYCMEPSPFSLFKNYGKLKKISNDVIRYKNQVYVTNELGILYLDKTSSQFKLIDGSNDSAIKFLVTDDEELLTTTDDGIARVDDMKIKEFITGRNLHTAYSMINSLKFPGRIYIATIYGLSVIEKQNNGKYQVVYELETEDEATTVVEDEDGNIWLDGFFDYIIHINGSINELSKGNIDNIKFDRYGVSNGLPGDVWSIYSVDNNFLISTNSGTYKFDNFQKKFVRDFRLGTLLSDENIFISYIAKNEKNELWVLAESMSAIHLGKAIPTNNNQYEWAPVKTFQGINLESVLSFYPEYYGNTEREYLWLNTINGLILFDSGIKESSVNDFSTLIRKVIINRDSLIYGGFHSDSVSINNNFNFSDNNLTFEFAAITYNISKSPVYSCILEGNDNNWTSWTSESIKEYTNLAPGDYLFRVKSKDAFGNESINEAHFSFTILPPWYLSWWAYFIYSFSVLALLYSIRKFELNRKDKNNRIIQSQLRAEAAEFQAKAAETQAKMVQAENDRKTKELEEARELQLSMLPDKLPEIENMDIEVYMRTATEVGGDYYDFTINDDNSINLVLGDATGHGMKAGIMVAIMKSMFILDSPNQEPKQFFFNSNNSIKNMHLDKMNMALSMVKIYGANFEFINAGVPPVLVIKNKIVEEVNVHGMPLGAMKNFQYPTETKSLETGDTVIMLSDGFPELLNKNGEMFGYERLANRVAELSPLSAKSISDGLKQSIEGWLDESEPDDDISFIIIKVI